MNTRNLWGSLSSQYLSGMSETDNLCISLILLLCSPSLAKYHTQLLTLPGDGTGSWTVTRIGTAEARMGIDREIGMLQSKLEEVEGWETRVKELEVMLGPQV